MNQGWNRSIGRLAAVFALCATMALTGCSEFFTPVNNTPGSGTSSFVYVTNASGTLAEYSLTSGALAALSGSPVTLSVAPTCIVVAPNNAFLYVGTATGIFLYTINSDGSLTEGNSNTVVYLNQNGYTATSMVVDPTSSWLIIAYQNQTEIDALPIDPTTGVANSTTAFTVSSTFGTLAPQLAIAPANNNVFVSLGSGGTEAFGFTPTSTSTTGPWGSAVSIHIASKTSASDTAVAVDPTSTYLYVTEADLATTPGAGNLRLIKISNLTTDLADYPTGVGPSAVLADPTGAYVYVTNSADATISGFSVNTTSQALTSLGDASPTEKSPIGLVEDNSKTYVMDVGNGGNPNLWLYSFDTSSLGTLDVSSTKSTDTVNPSVANGIAVTH